MSYEAKAVAVQHMDRVGLENFIEPLNDTKIATSTGTRSGDACGLHWDVKRPILYLTNTDTALQSVDGGRTWSSSFASASGTMGACASRQRSTCIGFVNSGGSGLVALKGANSPSDTWATTSLTGCVGVSCVAADPYSNSFWIGGARTGLSGIWRVSDNDGASPVNVATCHPATGTSAVQMIAAGRGVVLATVWNGSSSVYWRWVPGDATPTLVATPPSEDQCRALIWYERESCFFSFVVSVSSTTRIFRSKDGLSWTEMIGTGPIWDAQLPAVSADVANPGCITRGGVENYPDDAIVMPVAFDTGRYLAVSYDGCRTWRLLYAPINPNDGVQQKARWLGDRLMAFGFDSAGDVGFRLSMRTRV